MTIFCFLLLACCGSAIGQVTPIVTSCDGLVDIVFLLGSSSSMHQMGLQTVRNFIADVSMHFTLGPDNVRVGLATHSDTISPVFNLNTYSDNTNLAAALREVQSLTSSNHASISLDEVRKMFAPEVGARPNARKVIIILSDVDRAFVAAHRTKELGYRIITVAISEFHFPYLAQFASGPSDALSVSDVEALPSIEDTLTKLICPPLEKLQVISLAADIIFLLDASENACGESLSGMSYDHVRNFAVAIIERFSKEEEATRFGAVVFSSTPRKLFDLNAHSDYDAVAATIRTAPYLDGVSNIDKALSFITEADMFGSVNGGRSNATDVVVFVTHSKITTQDEKSFTSLKSQDIIVLPVGVGEVEEEAVKGVASFKDYSIFVDGFYALEYQQKSAGDFIYELLVRERRCAVRAYVFFVIDGSDQVNETEFDAAIASAAEISTQFKLGRMYTDIGVIIYGKNALPKYELLFKPGDHTNRRDLTQAITNASYFGGAANIKRAVDSLETFFVTRRTVGDQRKNVIIIMSAGRAVTYASAVVDGLKRLFNVRFATFGIGQDQNAENLRRWASDGYYFSEPSATNIDTFMRGFEGCMRTVYPST